MDVIPLTPTTYHLRGGANAGLIIQDGRAVLVDTGMDRDTAKKILRHIEALHVTLAAVVITHAHADHFGGAATVRARLGVPVCAPALEAAVVANPLLEPFYLFSGASPMAELRGKFILADACPVDRLLAAGNTVIEGVALEAIPAPGHAPNQMMIAGGGACFTGDAVFAPDILHKHGIPFYVDIDQAAATLATFPALGGRFAAFVPGHGPAVSEIAPWASENAARLAEIRAAVEEALTGADDAGALLKRVADRLGLVIGNPVTYCLTQTTILACLTSLQKSGRVQVRVTDNRLVWGRN
jgi:glyoxylase-like metal-dependent hydrolase (beta-lactamase superfamily II)